MKEWSEKTLGEFVSLQRGYDLPTESRGEGRVPVIGSFGITGYHGIAKAKGPGVTVGRSGASAGTVVYVEEDYWPHNTCLFVKDFQGNNPRFAYYLLSTLDLASHAAGSAQPSLNRNYIASLPLLVPERPEQEDIAAVLSALDDKIELNRRMNETLEALAQAIFKDWFVDFGPVRRKFEGATDPVAILGGLIPDPAKAAAIAALFPDSFGEESLPKGWRTESIYNLASVTYGAPFASSRFNSDGRGRPLIRIRDLPNHGSNVFTDEVHKKEFIIEPGTIVVGMDGEFRARIWHGSRSLMNQRVCAFLPIEERDRAFTYFSIIPQLRAHEQSAIGTTVIHLGKKEIDTFSAIQPGRELLGAFSKVAEPMLALNVQNGVQNRTLAETRDYLLPKLMSGEVRIRDVHEAMSG